MLESAVAGDQNVVLSPSSTKELSIPETGPSRSRDGGHVVGRQEGSELPGDRLVKKDSHQSPGGRLPIREP